MTPAEIAADLREAARIVAEFVERWSLDQWRAAIDKAMGGDSPK